MVLLLVELQTLPLDTSESVVVGPESVYVGQDPWIPESYEPSVDKKSGGVSRMEDVEVSIFDPMTVEIGRGICFGIEWSGVLSFFLALSTD